MAESAAYAVRTFLGGAALARIPAGLNAGALSATADDLSTWIGAVAAGNTRAMLDREGSNPEEVEISGISGNDITFSARGLEGTDDATHDANVTIELISSPRDFREANYWIAELAAAISAGNIVLVSDADNSLVGVTMGASTILARLAAGNVVAATPDQLTTLLALDTGDITGLAEYIADTVGAMVTSNTETGITVTYDDADNTLDFAVSGGASTAHLLVRKGSDESVTSSTVLQDDDALLFAIGAADVWAFEFVVMASGDPSGDISLAVAGPASATGRYVSMGLNTSATDTTSLLLTGGNLAGQLDHGVISTSVGTMLLIKGVVIGGGTAGNVKLQWAQRVSNGTATIVRANSHLIAHQIA